MRRMDKLSDNKAFALLSVTRRRTKVRREAKFVHSIKHYFLSVFCFLLLLFDKMLFWGIKKPLYMVFYAVYTFFTTPFALFSPFTLTFG